MLNRVLQEYCGMKAVFYARVSTEEEEQLNAIELQIEENRSVIRENKWELVDEYIDRGKSGTAIKGRDEYQRLYNDMLTDKFEVICIKDQDRLMRNTKDWYLFVDRLVTTGKKLYLYLDGKFFYPGEDALITGIKAIMAEEYSRNLSKKIKNYHNRRLEKARRGEKVSLHGNGNTYGWDKKGGAYTVNPEQFKVRRLMCEYTLQGKGSTEIANLINEAGYRNSRGNKWTVQDIPGLVYSELNIGTVYLNTEKKDFETKKRHRLPKSEWVKIENALPPVVTMEEWGKICAIRERRSQKYGVHIRGKKVQSYFSGRVVCGHCGRVYWRCVDSRSQRELWKCSGRIKNGKSVRMFNTINGSKGDENPGGCDNPTMSTEKLMEILNLVSSSLQANTDIIKADMIKYLNELKKSILGANTGLTEGDLKKEEQRKDKLLDSFLDGIISKEDYQRKAKTIEERIETIKSELEALDSKAEDVRDIEAIIKNIDAELEKYLAGNTELRLKWLMDNLKDIVIYEGAIVLRLPVIGRGVIAGKVESAQLVSRNGHDRKTCTADVDCAVLDCFRETNTKFPGNTGRNQYQRDAYEG